MDPSEFTILDGYFGNSLTGATERVTIIGRRLDDWNKVCVRDECGAYLSSMQDAASRLVSLGHQQAANSPQVLSKQANEILEKYEEPCIGADEDAQDYMDRATKHCIGYVVDALPWYTFFANAKQTASVACSARAEKRIDKVRDRDYGNGICPGT